MNKDEYDYDESDEYGPVGALIIQIDDLTPFTISQGGTPTERLTPQQWWPWSVNTWKS